MKNVEKLHEKVQDAVEMSLSSEHPIYGMAIHEKEDDPQRRVVYLGKNRDYTPVKVHFCSGKVDYGSWEEWEWLKGNRPVMCGWDGRIDYELDPSDYSKRADNGEKSDVCSISYEGNAMAVIPKIYTCSYMREGKRYVYFCDIPATEEFCPIGFRVRGSERKYMLIPMFYGAKDEKGRLRSIGGTWSAGTITGRASQNRDGRDMDTAAQFEALQKTNPEGLFFGGALVNVLTDIAVMLAKSTDTQASYGYGMTASFTSDEDISGHWGTEANPLLNSRFCGGDNGHTYTNMFHSLVPGSGMLWQRDPYMLLVYGKLKVSPEYIFDLSGEMYLDTGCVLDKGGFYSATDVVSSFGFVPSPDKEGADSTGYCDYIYANPEVISVASRFGCSRSGKKAGLFARSMNHSGFNRDNICEKECAIGEAEELDESFSWWWNFGCSLMMPGSIG